MAHVPTDEFPKELGTTAPYAHLPSDVVRHAAHLGGMVGQIPIN